MGMRNAGHIGSRPMNGAVDHITRLVDSVLGFRLPQDLAFDIDLDETGGGYLLVEKPVKIDEQMMVISRNARGYVIVDEVGHAVLVDEPVACRQINARKPFFRRDLSLQ